MARLFDTDPTEDFARFAIELQKFEDDGDGGVYVWGKATDGTLDRDDQIIDPDFAAKSLREWFETGANVRVMHSASLYPAGTGVELVSGDDGQWLKSHIVEPTAVKLVRAKALKAYSVGISRPKIIRDNLAKGGRVVGGETVEVSLVDRPANPSCGVVLAKMAGGDAVRTVELFGGELLGDVPDIRPAVPSPAAYARSLVKNGHAAGVVGPDGVVKRDFDANVGGGVDRDQLDAGDFVFGDERAFPIVTPGDVPDAVSSWGRYEGEHSFKAFKRSLTALANRKGPDFAAKLPKEWSKKRVDAELAKGDKDCGNCGKSYDSDTSAKFCSNCGNKLKAKATKSADTGADPDGDVDDALGKAKDAVRAAIGAQAKDPDGHTDPNDARVSAHLENADNALNSAQHAQTKDMAQDDDVEKAEKAALTGRPAAADGDTVALTPVADMSYGLRRLHDAVCGAYAWSAVKSAHPGLATVGLPSVVDGAPELLGTAVRQAAAELSAGDTDRIGSLSKAYAAAAALAGVDAQEVAEARAELVKDFRLANPGAPAMTPIGGEQRPSPGQFRRPYLSAGHANAFATAGQRPRIPDATHVPDASQFTRGPLTAGHQAPPPENTGDVRRPVVSDGGSHPAPRMAPGEGVTKAAAAAQALRAMHDHIADAYPDCCPMGPAAAEPVYETSAAQAAGAGGGAVPATKTASADLAKMATQEPDLFRAAIAAVVAERDEQLRTEYDRKIADLTTAHNQKVDDLTTKFNELAAQPDPRQAPFRGMAGIDQLQQQLAKSLSQSQEPPAAATDQRRREFIQGWLDSPDPAQREAARALLGS